MHSKEKVGNVVVPARLILRESWFVVVFIFNLMFQFVTQGVTNERPQIVIVLCFY
jgi:hypothetical protein